MHTGAFPEGNHGKAERKRRNQRRKNCDAFFRCFFQGGELSYYETVIQVCRASHTPMTDYLNMPLGRFRKVRQALINVLEREKEARED